MASPPKHDPQTEELLRRFRERRAQRRRRRLLGTVVGALILAALVLGAFWATADLHPPAPGDEAPPESESAQPKASSANFPLTTSSLPQATSAPVPSSTATSSTVVSSSTIRSTTTAPSTTMRATTSEQPSSTATSAGDTRPTVVIDPGHQAKPDYSEEPVGPGSTTKKAKVSSGTSGVETGTPESELVLTVALKLRDSLLRHGVKVIMTRTSQEVNISSIQRAKMANEAQADLFVRIHADGSDDHSVRGIHVLYPASIKGWTDDIAQSSKEAATLAQAELIAATGAVDLGIQARSDLTGFNWADVPVILAEIGFMTNPEEDRLLATPSYQDKIVEGLTRAILAFLGVS